MAIKIEEWVDGDVLTADDLNDSFGGVSKGYAEQANKILKAAGAYENGDTTASENYTTSAGVNGTVNTGSTTSLFDTDSYVLPDFLQDEGDATEFSLTGTTTTTTAYDITFATESLLEEVIIEIKNTFNYSDTTHYIDFYYNDATSQTVTYTTGGGNGTYVERTTANPQLAKVVTRVRYRVKLAYSSNRDIYLQNLSFFAGVYLSTSDIVCDTNTITLDGTEKAIQIYSDHETPTNTSVTVDVSDGTSTLVSGATFTGKFTDVLALTGVTSGTLELTFNLITTDASATPTQSGWGVYVIK